ALRRPRAKGAAFRNDAMDKFDASPRKAGPELRPGRGRRNAPSLPFDWLMQSSQVPKPTCIGDHEPRSR
ncbi:MAG TPA: hypothetical protein PLX89_23365, partial [Verrucomicrobiota bacterium]|nr:hypothetical protein [Verrucomicrobiota bacterium]